MDFGPQQFGKWLVLIGALIIVVGILVMLLGRIGLFRLPGDFTFGGRHWRIYIPLASSIILSLLLTLIFWLIHHFWRH
jgi:multisubunit Na+/H+ antiporter MnhG subunit